MFNHASRRFCLTVLSFSLSGILLVCKGHPVIYDTGNAVRLIDKKRRAGGTKRDEGVAETKQGGGGGVDENDRLCHDFALPHKRLSVTRTALFRAGRIWVTLLYTHSRHLSVNSTHLLKPR